MLDPDGPLRHTVPFVRVEHRALPSLGVAAALQGGRHRARTTSASTTTRSVVGDTRDAVGRADACDRRTAIDGYHWALINFRGPRASRRSRRRRPYPSYHFFDLLQLGGAAPRQARHRTSIPSVFKDKIVFVGVTAAGLVRRLRDAVRRRTAKMPGIQIHAAVADDILSNRFIAPASASVRAGHGCRLPRWSSASSRRCFRHGGRRASRSLSSRSRLARRCGCSRGGYWLNLSQPVARLVAGALRRRGVSVLRRGPREAEDEEAVRPVRLEGRLRPSGREPRRWRRSAGSGAR